MSTKPNNRSDAALRERLELAEKATQGPWKSDEVVTRKKDFEPSYVVKDKDGFTIVDVLPVSAYQATAAHIAASSPDVVREDIEEILRLRQEVARLDKEADWLIEYICNKCSTRCPMPEGYRCKHKFNNVCYLNPSETETRGRCWRWAARKAVEEEERHG